MRLLTDFNLRAGWQLAVGRCAATQRIEHATPESMVDQLVGCCLNGGRETFLEYALWKALTDTTLDACSRHDSAFVQSYLHLCEELISSRALPVRLPRIDGRPILIRWIEEILKPLSENWDRIKCPGCGSRATHGGNIKLQITRVTSEGTIYGRMICDHCKRVMNEATILAHCYQCKHYPLIIGKNPVCPSPFCNRLVCDWRESDSQGRKGARCKCCKPECSVGEQTPESDFGRDTN
jgi:hypothetical protein